MKHLVLAGLSVLSLLGVNSVQAQTAPILSTFDLDDEGWIGIPGEGSVTFEPLGGDPDGHIRVTDIGAAGQLGSGAIAPAKFLGDLSAFSGGTLSYEMATFAGGGGTFPVFGTVRITGGGLSVFFDVAAVAPPFATWQSYVAPLSANAWSYGLPVSPPVSDADWAAILASVTEIAFSTDAFDGPDTIGIDNVQICPICPVNCIAATAASLTVAATSARSSTFADVGVSEPRDAEQATLLNPRSFRRFRDQVLSRTPAGRRLVGLYNAHRSEVVRLLLGDSALRADLLEGLLLWQDAASGLADGALTTVTVTPAQARIVDEVANRLAAVGSRGLRQAIEAQRRRIPPGLTLAEALLAEIGHPSHASRGRGRGNR